MVLSVTLHPTAIKCHYQSSFPPLYLHEQWPMASGWHYYSPWCPAPHFLPRTPPSPHPANQSPQSTAYPPRSNQSGPDSCGGWKIMKISLVCLLQVQFGWYSCYSNEEKKTNVTMTTYDLVINVTKMTLLAGLTFIIKDEWRLKPSKQLHHVWSVCSVVGTLLVVMSIMWITVNSMLMSNFLRWSLDRLFWKCTEVARHMTGWSYVWVK